MIRHPHNPILSRADIQSEHPLLRDPSSVFNPGAVFFNGRYRLMLRTQSRSRETFFVPATSSDGIRFDVQTEPLQIGNLPAIPKVHHAYDARLSVIDGRCYMMYAVDLDDRCTLALAVSDDFQTFEFLGYTSGTYADTRNGVIFPEKINGKYLRLERPNLPQEPGNPTSGDMITISESDNLLRWNHRGDVMAGRWRFWDERIGAGPPPLKTKHGWLLIYHGVATHFASSQIYQAGAALLDLHDPKHVLARTRLNILEPRENYELTGQVPNVVFPSGCIPESTEPDGSIADDTQLNIYYGAADTSIGLATTTVQELIHACYFPDGEPGA
ncbi:glycoside hydrolase family 130 protein [Verrucomicrobiaceae bacterium N1E253]|uniref:Glycoside hydrolase family 130 protein n=1 Tax=Oceaniferula marina TaxID=2748318 RepID=A0A851GLU6_9BACT|nr:glycoside hydrolase family 130 protein [Oceaniferula marina]NWK56135.1 glycoside hydrolase family 130 protein [Oceaniferula marina]